MKSGTTSLTRYLKTHPDVFFVPQKEVHFFDRDPLWDRGLEWYAGLFAEAGDAKCVLEGSPGTMFYERAVKRLAATIPDAKLVAILRHPAERTWSHYWHERLHETTTDDFVTLFERELEEPQEPYIVGRSRYIHQLRRLEEHFPREQIHVMLLDDFGADPYAAWRGLCAFLGIDATFVPPILTDVVNPRQEIRARRLFLMLYRLRVWRFMSRPMAERVHALFIRPSEDPQPLEGDLRRRVIDVFRADNSELAAWLGRDLGAWDR
jgi:hypothetical protein